MYTTVVFRSDPGTVAVACREGNNPASQPPPVSSTIHVQSHLAIMPDPLLPRTKSKRGGSYFEVNLLYIESLLTCTGSQQSPALSYAAFTDLGKPCLVLRRRNINQSTYRAHVTD